MAKQCTLLKSNLRPIFRALDPFSTVSSRNVTSFNITQPNTHGSRKALFTGRLLDSGYYNGPFAVSSAFYIAALFFAEMLFGSTPAIVSFALEETLSGFRRPCNWIEYWKYCNPNNYPTTIREVDFEWSIRAVAFIITFAVIVANLSLRPQHPPSRVTGGLSD
ncbi:hypothetical protein PISMIDRAFT_20153 [Pisolithus microcarpus 441]|uniref:Uncharacterized protein n=1 Tax=Pisolithus microcarpus 441 TaxID=765257 RepID=A0A0C9Y9K9_9AGAM|nr:hypothetical protein BKA83DRAFT_20153 [Pisolithus microcarpus]KIK10724.1 hypothetical protein PISMIDRAFT_20153 [Pisolithus microcarpus 441]